MMNINILGIVENMSYVVCPDCGKKFSVFGSGDGKYDDIGCKNIGKIPIDPKLAELIDNGVIGRFSGDYLEDAVCELEKL